MMARSRSPCAVAMSGAVQEGQRLPESEPTCRTDADFDFAFFPRAMPAAVPAPAARCPSPRPLACGWPTCGWCRRHHTDSSGVFVQCGDRRSCVNPPEQRPSASAASAHRRRAPPRSTARMAGARRLLMVVWLARSGAPVPAGGWATCQARRRSTFALFPRAIPPANSGGQFQRPVPAPAARCPLPRPQACGWGCAPCGRPRIHCLRSVGRRGRTIFRMPAIRQQLRPFHRMPTRSLCARGGVATGDDFRVADNLIRTALR
jgi:hypothetical protein